MKILFYDTTAPYVYSLKTLTERAMGGTEATIIRVAQGLSRAHTVYVAQALRNKKDEHEEEGVRYLSLDTAHALQPDRVIVLRDALNLKKVGECYGHSKLFLWIHNFPSKKLFYYKQDLANFGYQIIAVSNYLGGLIEKRLRGKWYQRLGQKQPQIKINVIYNPIDDDLLPNATSWQQNKLLFLSAPYKGLADVIKIFLRVRSIFPELKLFIGDSGHREATFNLPEGVELLGRLPHPEIIQHLRESFCVFYPQYKKAETFGLIYAEANAVGTPVLAHDFGAAAEVLNDHTQLVDGRNLKQVIEKLSEWRQHRPHVRGKSQFKLSEVLKTWNKIIC
jgi:glycosyltransferase involved in cell wall biosynthesis